jgi:DNA-directed RNA polymerase III subunit RPC2
VLKRYNNATSDRVNGPMIDPVTKKPAWKHEIIDIDGFACVGQPVLPKQVFLYALYGKLCIEYILYGRF